jgi:hypothetical protein
MFILHIECLAKWLDSFSSKVRIRLFSERLDREICNRNKISNSHIHILFNSFDFFLLSFSFGFSL